MQTKVLKSLLTIVLTCICTGSANALEITRYVKPGGTGKGASWADACGSINQALDAIKTVGSGTVYVGPGNYTESVNIPKESKNINIMGDSENNMEEQEKDKVFISGAIEIGWFTENIRISCINVIKGNAGILLRGKNILMDNCSVSGCKTGIAEDGVSDKDYYSNPRTDGRYDIGAIEYPKQSSEK